MKIKDIMVSDVISVSPKTSISHVADIIFKNSFHGVPVTEKGKVIGIITEDDFFLKGFDDLFLPSYMKFVKKNKIAGNLPKEVKDKVEKLLNSTAKDIMTPDPMAVSPETDAEELMGIIKKTKFTTFPVSDENKNLLGIVTLVDILGIVNRGSQEMKKSLRKNGPARALDRLTMDLNDAWNDKVVIVSKKKINTWKGGIVLAFAFGILAAFFWLAMNSGDSSCSPFEGMDVVPLECQRFEYSTWSPCREDGAQIRTVIEKLPRNCEGGQPELIRACR